MKLGDRIQIVPSEELIEYRLMALSFREGYVVEIRTNQSGVFGAWIELIGEPYLEEQEWFIPVTSINSIQQ